MARRHLDKRLADLSQADRLTRPPRGWIRAIRQALGMTTAQLAKRIGVSQPRVVGIEKAETDGSLTLESLERAARALDCRLVYALVPRTALEAMVEDRARAIARRRLTTTSHSMALEAQRVDETIESEQLERMVRKLVDKAGSELWETNGE
jgi:predicted DNA-binding mobile mystery protein A